MEKTLARIGYAMIKNSTPEGVEYNAPIYLESTKAGGREISSEPQGSLQEVDADGIIVMSHDVNGGYTHNLTLLDILDSVDKDWLNKRILEDGSVVEVADGKVAPRFALIVAKETLNDDKLYNIDIYFNTTASRYTKNAKSNKPGEEIDFEFPQYSLTSRPLEVSKIVHQKLKSDTLPATIEVPSLPDDSSDSSTDNSSASTDNSGSDGE
jgi:hypothetical protein